MQSSTLVKSPGVGLARGIPTKPANGKFPVFGDDATGRFQAGHLSYPPTRICSGDWAWGYLTLLPGPKLLESLCVANRAAIALDWDWLGQLQKVIAITLGEVLVYDDLQPAVATYTVVPGIALQILLGHSPIRGACHEAPSQ
jgi:hypothetical protein